jgi:manganese/zinc/iron transport system substrate-binding protein
MNKNIFYIGVFFLSVGFFSYIFPPSEKKMEKKRVILSTTVMIDSVVKEIVGDRWNTQLLIEGEIDPHSYQLRKGDKEKIERAEIVFGNGLSLEHNPSLYYLLTDKKAVFVGDCVMKSHPEKIIVRKNEIDPHIWMDLSVMSVVAKVICEKLCEVDPKNSAEYQANTVVLEEKMAFLDKEILEMFSKVPMDRLYLVSSHDAFNYFVKKYFIQDGDNRLFSMQGLSTEADISLKRIQQVIEYIKFHKIPIVFFESNLPKDGLYKVIEICKQFGLEVSISSDPLYGDTLGGMTYLEMMKHNAVVMTNNLKKGM